MKEKKKKMINSLEDLKEGELIRFYNKDNEVHLDLVLDCLDEHDECEEEEHSCCENLNGHLFTYIFKHITNLKISGDECDNYVLINSNLTNNSIYLEYEGKNLFEDDSKLIINFNYIEFEVKDLGKIEGPDV